MHFSALPTIPVGRAAQRMQRILTTRSTSVSASMRYPDTVGCGSGRPCPSSERSIRPLAPVRAPGSASSRWVQRRHRRPRIVGPACDADLVVVVFDAELWTWDARRADSWIFVSLPADVSEEIRDLAGGSHRGFGSLPVQVTVGGSTWTTSIFPSSGGAYVLPIKRPVRTAEALDVGDVATVTIELIDL